MNQLLLTADVPLAELLGVAAGVLRVFDVHVELDEGRTQTLNLFFHYRTRVKGFDHRSDASCRGNRLQSRYASSNNQYARRPYGASRRHQHGKKFLQRVRRQQDCLVTGNSTLRGKRVHHLRARRARHQLHAAGDDFPLCQLLKERWIRRRLK